MTKFIIAASMLLSVSAHAGVYWTTKINGGVHATAGGTVAINIGNYTPTGPNPSNTVWQECKNNWVYLNKKADGTRIEDKYIERMLAIAISAYKTDSRVRLSITRDEAGKCYSSQIYDQG